MCARNVHYQMSNALQASHLCGFKNSFPSSPKWTVTCVRDPHAQSTEGVDQARFGEAHVLRARRKQPRENMHCERDCTAKPLPIFTFTDCGFRRSSCLSILRTPRFLVGKCLRSGHLPASALASAKRYAAREHASCRTLPKMKQTSYTTPLEGSPAMMSASFSTSSSL